jgi:hypothetical protein
MTSFRRFVLVSSMAAGLFAGCESTGGGTDGPARVAMVSAIKAEQPGYFVGRRYFKTDYKFWGFIRASGQPWSTAKLVMMNENSKLAPDREGGKIGSDNNYEYKMFGEFTGDTVYEPASNRFYPEFRLKGAQLLSSEPAKIYREGGATDPDRRIIAKPY